MSDKRKDRDDDDDDDNKPARLPPAPQPVLIPEPIGGGFTIGTPVKYSGSFYTVCRVIAGTDKLDLIGFDANDIPVYANDVAIATVQRYRRV